MSISSTAFGMRRADSAAFVVNATDKNSRKLPLWDSSDPDRNPPPLPLNPDSPYRNQQTGASTPGSRSGSPSKAFGSKTLTSLNDERINDIMALSKQIKESQTSVEDSLKDVIVEFDGLTYRSRDNAQALSRLKDQVKRTEDNSSATKEILETGMADITSSIQTQQHSQKSIQDATGSLLTSADHVQNLLQIHENFLKEIISKTSEISQVKETQDKLLKTSEEHHKDIKDAFVKNIEAQDMKNLGLDDVNEVVSATVSSVSDNVKSQYECLLDHFKTMKSDLSIIVEDVSSNTEKSTQKTVDTILSSMDNKKQKHLDEHLGELKELKEVSRKSMAGVMQKLDSVAKQQNKALSTVVEKIIEVNKSRDDINTNAKVLEQVELLSEKLEHKELKEFISSVNSNIVENQQKSSNTMSEIQADIRSLIDLQYGNSGDYAEQIEKLSSQLEKFSHTEKGLQEERKTMHDKLAKAELHIKELEKELRDRDAKVKESDSNSKVVGGYQQQTIEKNEETIRGLEATIKELQATKTTLVSDVDTLKMEIKMRLETADQLEARVGHFEQRLNQSLLEKSKNVLGSAALAVLNNAGTTQRLGIESPSKRNVSVAHQQSILQQTEDGKENTLTVGKRGGGTPLQSPLKNRSISLYTDTL